MLTLIGLVVVILGLGFSKTFFFKPAIKYCPNGPEGLDQNTIQIINSDGPCDREEITEKGIYEECVKFKGCTVCPEHGKCDRNGTFAGCEPTYDQKHGSCVENE
jgi:hypothetical protein